MTPTVTGWIIFVAALGMMLTLIAGDVSGLKSWSEALHPSFIGASAGHLGVVIAAFVGGKLIPTKDK